MPSNLSCPPPESPSEDSMFEEFTGRNPEDLFHSHKVSGQSKDF